MMLKLKLTTALMSLCLALIPVKAFGIMAGSADEYLLTRPSHTLLSARVDTPRVYAAKKKKKKKTKKKKGNAKRGALTFESYCQACHSPRDKAKRSAAMIKYANKTEPEMQGLGTLLTGQMYTDLVAFLKKQ